MAIAAGASVGAGAIVACAAWIAGDGSAESLSDGLAFGAAALGPAWAGIAFSGRKRRCERKAARSGPAEEQGPWRS
jgi:hypothetical protein